MSVMLLKALVAALVVCLLSSRSAASFFRERNIGSLLHLLGAG
jgi:hypothetical protein